MDGRARENGIEFALEANGPLPELIVSDPTRIRQILNNIVGNAVKFTERGRVSLAVEFRDHSLILSVRDTGKGFPMNSARICSKHSRKRTLQPPEIRRHGSGSESHEAVVSSDGRELRAD